MKSAIVSGATGFIGVHLCHELISNGVQVIGLVRKNSNSLERLQDEVRVVNCGMDDYASLNEVDVDTFYHLAWEGATGARRDDETLQVKNLERTIEALKAAKRCGCKRFVGLGTVYERLTDQILSDSRHRKADFYLLSKLGAHQMCLKLAQKLGIEFVWATIFQPIGKYIKKEQVMAYTINSLLNGISPEYGPALEPYDITAVEDVALGLRLLGDCNLSRNEYYIGSGNPMIMKEYLERTKIILNSDTDLLIGKKEDDGLRFSFDWFDISAIKEDTGFVANYGFDKAVTNMVDWLKSGEKI